MRSAAFGDYAVRMRECRFVIKRAVNSADPSEAVALAKGAAVLAAAALERYVNDVVVELCSRLNAQSWDELTEGQQRYLVRQMARRLYPSSRAIFRRADDSERRRRRLRTAVSECASAMATPSSWPHHVEYGMFMDGAAEPSRVDQTLRMFDDRGRSVFAFVEARGKDRRALAAALQGLIEARHKAAHALAGTFPAPSDVRVWIGLSTILAREIEAYLGYRA